VDPFVYMNPLEAEVLPAIRRPRVRPEDEAV
jgi:hypothetical protein